eukprot:2764388-Karenia_brevis.AAC.1
MAAKPNPNKSKLTKHDLIGTRPCLQAAKLIIAELLPAAVQVCTLEGIIIRTAHYLIFIIIFNVDKASGLISAWLPPLGTHHRPFGSLGLT